MDWGVLIQSLAAIVSCIIAWLAYRLSVRIDKQQKEIKELVDITNELKNHTLELSHSNEILQKRYELEDKITLKDRIPFFIRASNDAQINSDYGVYVLHLLNIGTKGYNITGHYPLGEKFTIHLQEHEVENNRTLTVKITFSDRRLMASENYEFSIKFVTIENIEMFQTISQDDLHRNSYRISIPQYIPDNLK